MLKQFTLFNCRPLAMDENDRIKTKEIYKPSQKEEEDRRISYELNPAAIKSNRNWISNLHARAF